MGAGGGGVCLGEVPVALNSNAGVSTLRTHTRWGHGCVRVGASDWQCRCRRRCVCVVPTATRQWPDASWSGGPPFVFCRWNRPGQLRLSGGGFKVGGYARAHGHLRDGQVAGGTDVDSLSPVDHPPLFAPARDVILTPPVPPKPGTHPPARAATAALRHPFLVWSVPSTDPQPHIHSIYCSCLYPLHHTSSPLGTYIASINQTWRRSSPSRPNRHSTTPRTPCTLVSSETPPLPRLRARLAIVYQLHTFPPNGTEPAPPNIHDAGQAPAALVDGDERRDRQHRRAWPALGAPAQQPLHAAAPAASLVQGARAGPAPARCWDVDHTAVPVSCVWDLVGGWWRGSVGQLSAASGLLSRARGVLDASSRL